MPTYTIHHVTSYHYDWPVKENSNRLRLFPLEDAQQKVLQRELIITGNPIVSLFTDYFGNTVGDFNLMAPHVELVIDSRLVVATASPAEIKSIVPTFLPQLAQLINRRIDLLSLSLPEEIQLQEKLNGFIAQLQLHDLPIQEIAQRCCAFVFTNFQYQKGITDVTTTIDEILLHQSGVCQDFAHVLLQMLRTIGVPARYVSGYICPNKSGLRGEGATHAWVEYYHPNLGWLGVDPTNNIATAAHHIRLATGKDFADCSPVMGTFKGVARQKLSVYVSVGYEDGHVFEEQQEVKLAFDPISQPAPWQDAIMAQQQ